MSSEFSEEEVLREIKNLMLNSHIRPEPQFQFFSRYIAGKSGKEVFLLNDDEIFDLVNVHGVQVVNDVKYWIDISKCEYPVGYKNRIPVLNPYNFLIHDFWDLKGKLKQLPSEWTILQITRNFSVADVTRKQDVREMYLTRLSCGDVTDRLNPYAVMTDNSNFHEDFLTVLNNLIKTRKEFYDLGRTNKKLYQNYYSTNTELESFVKELELYVLGPWICLFQGRLEDTKLEKETLAEVRRLVNAFCKADKMETMPNEMQIDVVYQLALSAHLLKDRFIFEALRSVLYLKDSSLPNVAELMMLIENIKILNLSNNCALKRAKKKPLILILDNELESVPWEMLTVLAGHPVCRIASIRLLYALYWYHEPHIKNGYRIVGIDYTYCLVNPGGDLLDCEKEMKEFLQKRAPWAEVELGKAPDAKDLLSKLGNCSLYLFCGHGTGGQYLKIKDLRRASVKCLVLLFGCSSNIPKNCGGRTPFQNCTYSYISNGCPCIIGCIQDLGSADADAVCKDILSSILPIVTTKDGRKAVLEPKEPDVLKAVATGRFACSKFWSKSAFVVRGIPCKITVGNIKHF